MLLNGIIIEKKQKKKNMESFGMYKKQKVMLKEKLQSMIYTVAMLLPAILYF